MALEGPGVIFGNLSKEYALAAATASYSRGSSNLCVSPNNSVSITTDTKNERKGKKIKIDLPPPSFSLRSIWLPFFPMCCFLNLCYFTQTVSLSTLTRQKLKTVNTQAALTKGGESQSFPFSPTHSR